MEARDRFPTALVWSELEAEWRVRKWTGDGWWFCVTGVMLIVRTPSGRGVGWGSERGKAEGHDCTTLTHFLLVNVEVHIQRGSTR